MQSLDVNRMVLGAVKCHDDGNTGLIIVDHETLRPKCELCNSFNCFHVKYAMSLPAIREDYKKSVKSLCLKCLHSNFSDALFCVKCGSKLGVD